MRYFRWMIQTLRAIGLLLRNPKKLYFVLHSEEQFQKTLFRKFPEMKAGLPEITLNQLFPNFHGELKYYSFLGGTSEPTDLLLLKNLALRIENCRYFEIGTWRGESLINLAEVATECHSLNLSAEQLRTFGYTENEIAAQDFYLKNLSNITQHKADSREFDFSKPGKFDLIFIDGDHHRAVVAQDTRKVFEHLVHQNSIVVWHDYTEHFSSIWWEVFLGILEGFPAEKRNRLYHVRNTNCAVYLPFEMQTEKFENPWLPKQNFKVTILSDR